MVEQRLAGGVLRIEQEAEVKRSDVVRLAAARNARLRHLKYDAVTKPLVERVIPRHQERINLAQGGIGIAAHTDPALILRDHEVEDLRQEEKAADDSRVFNVVVVQMLFDEHRHWEQQAGAGAAGEGTDDDYAQRLRAHIRGKRIEIADRVQQRAHFALLDRPFKDQAGDRAYLTGAFRGHLAVENIVDWKPDVARVRIRPEILSDLHTIRNLDRLCRRILTNHGVELVGVRIDDDKADILALFLADKLGHTADNFRSGAAKTDDQSRCVHIVCSSLSNSAFL